MKSAKSVILHLHYYAPTPLRVYARAPAAFVILIGW